MADLSWALKLTDQMSMPALKMARSVDGIIGSLKSTESALKQTDGSLKNVGASFQSAATEAMGTSKAIDKVYESSMKAAQGIDRLSDAMRRMHITQGAADSDELMMKLQALKNTQAKDDIGVEMAKLDKIVKAKNLRNAAMGFARETGADQANIAGWREKFETGGIIKMRNEYNRLTEAAEKSARAMAVSKVESQLLSKSKPADPSIAQRMIGGFGKMFGAKATGKLMGGMESLSKWDDELNKVGMSLGGVVAGGAAIAVGAILAVAAAVAAVVVGFGSLAVKASVAFAKMAVSSGMFRENTLMTFEVMLKSKAAATSLYDEAVKVAASTPLETNQVITAYKDLLARGFKSDELKPYITALSDFSSATGADKFQPALEALGKIRNSGKLTGEALESLVAAGIPLPDLIAKLGGKTKDDIMGMDSAKALSAILDVINEKYGGLSDQKSKLMEGLWSTASSRPDELFNEAFKKNAGLQSYYDGMKNFVDWLGKTLDPSSPTGTRVVALIDRLGAGFAGLTGIFDQKTATDSFSRVLSVVEALMPYLEAFMKGLGPGFKAALEPIGKLLEALGKDPGKMDSLVKGFEALGWIVGYVAGNVIPLFIAGIGLLTGALATVAGIVGKVIQVFQLLTGAPAKAMEQLRAGVSINLFAEGSNIGASLMDGIVGGITGRMAAVAGAASGAAAAVVAAAAGPKGFDAHSPSKKFERLGGYASEGLAIGITKQAPTANAAVADMVSPPSTGSVASQWSSAGQASGSSSSGPTVVIENLTIQAENPDDYERKTLSLFERLALQLNGAPA